VGAVQSIGCGGEGRREIELVDRCAMRGARRSCTLAALALLLGGGLSGTPSKKCKKGVRASTECFFAAGSDRLAEYVETFVDEGFELCVRLPLRPPVRPSGV